MYSGHVNVLHGWYVIMCGLLANMYVHCMLRHACTCYMYIPGANPPLHVLWCNAFIWKGMQGKPKRNYVLRLCHVIPTTESGEQSAPPSDNEKITGDAPPSDTTNEVSPTTPDPVNELAEGDEQKSSTAGTDYICSGGLFRHLADTYTSACRCLPFRHVVCISFPSQMNQYG